jgi:hypothetical protein
MGKPCELCSKPGDSHEAPMLLPLLVSPTFLKGIDQPRLSLIWHWAHLALRQADRVVFVGYSLPTSDFAFRNLLKRSVGAGVAVDVVLTEADDYRPNTLRELRSAFPAERYRQFFGTKRVNLHLQGLEQYFLET